MSDKVSDKDLFWQRIRKQACDKMILSKESGLGRWSVAAMVVERPARRKRRSSRKVLRAKGKLDCLPPEGGILAPFLVMAGNYKVAHRASSAGESLAPQPRASVIRMNRCQNY